MTQTTTPQRRKTQVVGRVRMLYQERIPEMKTFVADNGHRYYLKSRIPWFIKKFFARSKPNMSKTYTVIWYDEGDDFMFTTVETAVPYPSGDDLLTLAAQKEYNSIMRPEDAQHLVESFRDFNHGLVGVIKGEHKSIINHLTLL